MESGETIGDRGPSGSSDPSVVDPPSEAVSNVAVSQRWWDDVWRDGDLDAVDELFADPFVRHTEAGSEPESCATFKARLSEIQRGLARADTVIDDRVAAGDRVWTRATSRGVNTETGEPAVVSWLMVQRFAGGRIVEHWVATFPGVEWTA